VFLNIAQCTKQDVKLRQILNEGGAIFELDISEERAIAAV
jgi:hypothetical protein